MSGRLLFLGTGASMGIPVMGCSCNVCLSSDPHNRRMRAAVLVTYAGRCFLLDTGPDIRQQALQCGLKDLSGVILTHAHYDHVAGLDDLRPLVFRRKEPLPLLLSKATWHDLSTRFDYLFNPSATWQLNVQLLPQERGRLLFENLPLRYFTYEQVGMPVNGFRFGNLAYISDIRKYPETLFEDLKAIEILIVSALRLTPSPMHFTVDEAIDFSLRCQASQTWLTHIAHDLDHAHMEAYLPSNVHLAYDGLELPFCGE